MAGMARRRPYQSGAAGHDKIELLLLRPRQRGNSRQRLAQRPEDAQATFDPIGPDRIGNGEEMTSWITNFVSFHGAILKQGVGHLLSHGERFSKYFRLRRRWSRFPSRAPVARARLRWQ